MTFTTSGPLLLLVLLYFFVFKPGRLAFVLVFFAPFSATAIVNFGGLAYKSGGLGLTPAVCTFMLFLVAQIGLGLAFRPVVVSAGLLIQSALVGLFAAIVVLSLAVAASYGPVTSYQVTQTIYVLIGVATTVLFAFEFSRPGGVDSFVRTIRASAIFVSIWGLVQFACYSTHIPYPEFLFNNSKSDAADLFDQVSSGTIRIASVAIEPSFFASSMLHFVSFGATLLVVEPRFRTRYWVWPVALASLVLVLSTSSTAYIGLVVLAGLLLLRRPRTAMVVGAPLVVLAGAVLLLVPRAAQVLATMTIDKSDSFSYVERTTGAILAIRTFVENPILGRSWGSVTPFNAVTTTLADVGLIGALVFTAAGLATLLDLQPWRATAIDNPDWRTTGYAMAAQNTLIVAVVISISSGIHYVVADDWCFWGFAIALTSTLKLPLRLKMARRTAVAPTVSFSSNAVPQLPRTS